jgi:hypothetical protein
MTPRDISRPRPGLYKMRLVKGGPWCPARIQFAPSRDPLTNEPMDRSPLWSAEIAGALIADPAPCPVAAGVMRIWESGRHIDLAEYRYLQAQAEYDRQFAPAAADPRRPVDVRAIPPIF